MFPGALSRFLFKKGAGAVSNTRLFEYSIKTTVCRAVPTSASVAPQPSSVLNKQSTASYGSVPSSMSTEPDLHHVTPKFHTEMASHEVTWQELQTKGFVGC
ncbi:unnamed protein product [Vitrella brassicaformis CCMP3155]|uniref:Uncharacterized protein n=2 Tax=Vitrella brassicaformis TaxID=1169539 RepID=A0A0G4G6V4_VITBC|nr:unnamed protein product [Vitrella brassicaformis CCMP3155]|eukprot:CEM23942.1 unnamed protein product [Vitrella brassicaformis CCMP3155]